MNRAQEMVIRSTIKALQAAAETLASLVAREEPDDSVRCPQCGSVEIAQAGDDFVCASCNTNFKV